MSSPVQILGQSTGVKAKVTKFGQLVVAPIDYSTTSTVVLNATGTPFNILSPETGKAIVITDIIVNADKSVSNTTPANIEIYSAEEADLLTVFNLIVAPQLTGSSQQVMTGLNLLIDAGLWVNAKTDDASVLVTIMSYRLEVEQA